MRTACKLLPLPSLHAWTTFCYFYSFDIDISFRFNVPRSRDTLSLYPFSLCFGFGTCSILDHFFQWWNRMNSLFHSFTLVNIRVQVSFDGCYVNTTFSPKPKVKKKKTKKEREAARFPSLLLPQFYHSTFLFSKKKKVDVDNGFVSSCFHFSMFLASKMSNHGRLLLTLLRS